MADTDQRNRIVFLGAGRVGKTAILKRFLFNTFAEEYKETVEDLFVRDYNIRGSLIKVDLLDTAGNLTFPAMRRLSITTAHAFVLVYAITRQESFEEVKRLWTQIQEERPSYQVGVFLIYQQMCFLCPQISSYVDKCIFLIYKCIFVDILLSTSTYAFIC